MGPTNRVLVGPTFSGSRVGCCSSHSEPERGTSREGTAQQSLDSFQANNHPSALDAFFMAHTISLGAALLLLVLAILFLFLIGPFALLILIVVVVLLWYAFGPGARRAGGSS